MGADTKLRDAAAAADPEPALAGMGPSLRGALGEALAEVNGLVLFCGPAGSGKSSTLASLAAARPDALAFGRLDDRASAVRAVEAARRSLVLAAVEASDGIACIHLFTRLGIDTFRFACALRFVLAQRLVGRLCGSCRVSVQPPDAVTAPLGFDPGSLVHEARGCGMCAGSGYAGRVAVFEAIPIDAEVGRLIVCGGEGAAIANHVFRSWPNLAAGVRRLVAQGETTAAEAIRLLKEAQRQ